jgi:hypothetical protein
VDNGENIDEDGYAIENRQREQSSSYAIRCIEDETTDQEIQ